MIKTAWIDVGIFSVNTDQDLIFIGSNIAAKALHNNRSAWECFSGLNSDQCMDLIRQAKKMRENLQ